VNAGPDYEGHLVADTMQVGLPVAPLPDLIRWWESQKTRGLVIGALAVSLLAKPRVTRDLDGLVLVPEDQWPTLMDSSQKFGFVPRLDDALAFARQSRMLLLRHEATAIDVDVSLGSLAFEEEAVARATPFAVAGVTVPLPTPEDLIIMKAVAGRPQDLLDIDTLLAAFAKIDLRRVRHWVRAFADTLETPELNDTLEMCIQRRPRLKRGKKKK
jgi:Nucleotidyl transferase of unknown function (DUF2204)